LTGQSFSKPASKAIIYLLFSTALIGHIFLHFPHSIQLSSSIEGKPNPSCEIAPAGQTLIKGQRWFWGHAKGLIVSAIIKV